MPDIIVRNFQCVEEAKIGVHGFTVLRGASSNGKSSVIKAVDAAVNNRFGSKQVKYGEEAATIKIRWDSDSPVLTVVRKAEGGSPVMKLGDRVWSKLTRSLPREVEDLNNLGTLSVNSSTFSLNFYNQFQKPLLLEFSQKRVMDIISASKAMEELNLCYALLLKKAERNRGAEAELDSLLNQTKALLSEAKMIKRKLAPLYDKIELVNLKYQSITKTIDDMMQLMLLIQNKRKESHQLELCEQCIDLMTKRQEVIKHVMQLECYSHFISEYEESKIKLATVEKNIDKLTSIRFLEDYKEKMDLQVVSLRILYQNLVEVKGCKVRYAQISDNMVKLQYVKALKVELEEAIDRQQLLNSVMRSYAEKESVIKELRKLSIISVGFEELKSVKKKITECANMTNLVENLNSMMCRISDINNILDNGLCPCCGKKLSI